MVPDEIDVLVKQGRHDDAAQLAVASGQLARALDIYEKLWRFDAALPLALQLGDQPRAVRLALEARQPDKARQIADSIPYSAREQLERVVDALAGRGHFEDAARTAERAHLPARAADLYRRAGLLGDAARMLTAEGRLREAAEVLERLTQQAAINHLAPSTPTALHELANAQLQLGRLLARLGRPLEAARILQAAARQPVTMEDAQKNLCGVLLTLGLGAAAEEVARRLSAMDPHLSPSAQAIASGLHEQATAIQPVPDRFDVQRLLGGGATGRVYLAHDRLIGRDVALKALSVGATHAEDQALAHFLRETEVAGRLRHPHIVALLDLDIQAGVLVLEFLPGGSLVGVLAERKRLPPASVRRLGLELLDALATAHAAGIVHRDVKPANIFFDAAGGAKLGDFGTAHLQDFGDTQTGGLIGTLAYLSPEQVTGAPIGPQADLYALAATLFEALTGRPPFLGPDFVSQHLGDVAPPPSQFVPGLHTAFDAVLARALAKAPDERYASAVAMAEALRSWPVEQALAPGLISGLASASASDTGISAHDVQEDPPLRPPDPEPRGETLVGHTQTGRLLVRHDPRVDRQILVEVRTNPLGPEELLHVRTLAAAGGPHVQRMLGLSADHTEITYELIEGEPAELDDLAPEWHQLFTTTATKLGCTPPRIVTTPAGPVLLITPSSHPVCAPRSDE